MRKVKFSCLNRPLMEEQLVFYFFNFLEVIKISFSATTTTASTTTFYYLLNKSAQPVTL